MSAIITAVARTGGGVVLHIIAKTLIIILNTKKFKKKGI